MDMLGLWEWRCGFNILNIVILGGHVYEYAGNRMRLGPSQGNV